MQIWWLHHLGQGIKPILKLLRGPKANVLLMIILVKTSLWRPYINPIWLCPQVSKAEPYLHETCFQDSSTFGQLYTLFDLDLSFNQLKKLGRGVFSGLASLRSIQV